MTYPSSPQKKVPAAFPGGSMSLVSTEEQREMEWRQEEQTCSVIQSLAGASAAQIMTQLD